MQRLQPPESQKQLRRRRPDPTSQLLLPIFQDIVKVERLPAKLEGRFWSTKWILVSIQIQ